MPPKFFDLSQPPEWATARGSQPPAKDAPKGPTGTVDASLTSRVVEGMKGDVRNFIRGGRLMLGLDKPESAEDYVMMTAAGIPALFAGGAAAQAALPQLGRFAAPLGRMAAEGLSAIPGAIKEGSAMEPLKRMGGAAIAEATMGAGRWGLGKLAEPAKRIEEGVRTIGQNMPARTQAGQFLSQKVTVPLLGGTPMTVADAAQAISNLQAPMRGAALNQVAASLNKIDPTRSMSRMFRDSVAPGHVLHAGSLRLGRLSPTGPVSQTAKATGEALGGTSGALGQAGIDVLAGQEPAAAAAVPLGIGSMALRLAPHGVRRFAHDAEEGVTGD